MAAAIGAVNFYLLESPGLVASHLTPGRGEESDLLLGPNAFGASDLTQTEGQQDAQRKEQKTGMGMSHFYPYLQRCL